MKRLVLLATVTLFLNALSAQIPFSNSFNTFFTQTNPAIASVQDYSAVTIGRKEMNLYNASLFQALFKSSLGSHYIVMSNNRNGFFNYSDVKIEAGYSNGFSFRDWFFAGGLDVNFGYGSFDVGSARKTSQFLNTDLGFIAMFKNIQIGFCTNNFNNIGDQNYSKRIGASLIHRISISRSVELNYAIILYSFADLNQPINLTLGGLKWKNIEIGTGFQYRLRTYNRSSSFFAAYAHRSFRISYNYLHDTYHRRWHQHEIGFQFAFNTKGKEVNFLPF
jgi:hypothetical protein